MSIKDIFYDCNLAEERKSVKQIVFSGAELKCLKKNTTQQNIH